MDLERLRWVLPGLVLMAMAVTGALPTRVEAQAVCNANVNLTYTIPSGHNFLLPPEPVTVNVQLTTGTISGGVGGNFADLKKVRFQLDCDPAGGLFVGCPNTAPGNEVSYDGDTHISVGGTCVDQNGSAVTLTSSLPAGGSGSVNNQVVFTFSAPVRLAASDTTGCSFSFQITVLTHDDDATVNRMDEVVGYDAVQSDATCTNGGVSGGSQSGFLDLCPVCNDNNACTTDSCNTDTGACSFVPITCADNNACTTDTCNPATGCVFTPISCDDQNACTTDTCNPATGCVHTPISCDDQNTCTTDTCNPATGCVHTPITCNDNNACTTDTCNAATGCVFTPISCDDQNACTTDSCNPATGCVHTPITCNDENACTIDTCNAAIGCVFSPISCTAGECATPGCDAASGCFTTPSPDGTACASDGNSCTDDVCVSGACTHPTKNPLPAECAPPIPTLSEWGMIMLVGLLALGGILAVRRKGIRNG